MSSDPAPLSKTAKYKKITKPLLERKRRARINRCLDELKDLMVGALEIDDDNLSKLEKADILELTVNHLTKLHSPRDPVLEAKKFQAGFGQCAAEACRFIMSVPDLDAGVGRNLIGHLSGLLAAPAADAQHCCSDQERSSSDAEESPYAGDGPGWACAAPCPAEAKDALLQKIRRHIMDKRGAEGRPDDGYAAREEPPAGTLDLRTVRAQGPPVAPERCESPKDYSNLPPKKKRKLIEYQEYKRQEAARRREAFYAENHREEPSVDEDGNKWRPW